MNGELDNKKKVIVCPSRTYEEISIAVPVEVHAHANVGEIVLRCRGHRIIKDCDRGRKKNRYTIVQEVSVLVPIECVTEVEVKDERVDYDVHDEDRG